MKGVTGSWSKYGGGRGAVVKAKITSTWTCQSCAKERPKEVSPYLYEFMEGEYIRVCASCLKDGVVIFWERRDKVQIRLEYH